MIEDPVAGSVSSTATGTNGHNLKSKKSKFNDHILNFNG